MGKVEVIKIRLSSLKDWFVATSDNEALKGLYLADSTYDAVVKQLPEAIRLLYWAQERKKLNKLKRFLPENDAEKRSTDVIEYWAEVA